MHEHLLKHLFHKQIYLDGAVCPLEEAFQLMDNNYQVVVEVACIEKEVQNQDLHQHLEEDPEVVPKIGGVACALHGGDWLFASGEIVI